MKPAYLFRDQVNALAIWFKEWNDCEQTVALYSLLRRVSPTQARFLTQVLEQTLADSDECQRLEQEANDISFVCSLCNESKEIAVAQLLSHLPLLRPGNNDVKKEYLSLIPKILLHSVENSQHLEESRQVLSYLLIHPALSNEDRSSLAWWLGRLEEHTNSQAGFPSRLQVSPDLSPSQSPSPSPSPFPGGILNSSETGRNGLQGGLNGWRAQPTFRDSGAVDFPPTASHFLGSSVPHQPLTNTLSAPPAVNVTGPSNDVASSLAGPSLPVHQRKSRSHSLTPPNSCSNTPSPQPLTDWPSEEELEPRTSRSLSLPIDHAPLSPQSSTASSGSSTEAHGEDGGLWSHGGGSGQPGPPKRNSFLEENSGMRDVPSWLKSLRLHKYSGLFQQMTYDEMMLLNEGKLESMNVTKGARHKIVLSIQKLKERQLTLYNLEKDILNDNSPGNLRNALNEVKSMLNTPIKVYEPLESSSEDSTSSQPSEDGEKETKEGDFPGQLTRFMGKMCTQLLVAKRPDEDNVSLYLQLLDKCLNHEAFTAAQKKRFLSWRQSCQKFSRNPYPRKLSLQETKQPRTWGHYSSNYPGDYGVFAAQGPGGNRRPTRPPFAQPQPQGQAQPHPQRINSLLTGGGSPALFRPTQTSNMYMKPRQLPGNPHIGVQRTKSAPIRRSSQPAQPYLYQAPPPQDVSNQPMGDPEITNRLENLCLSMTEHALSDGGEQHKSNRN
ncbi:protein Smaug homolog 1-like isoform X2 [Acanthaster planci]|uniref:Protein Smaug homolog 1-like isoform X2 n=1 Tax=Acanthaster planci TaxID=133434 RepID=A0A8B7YNF5_ACAPL|nr:protein Smaug homolog 1-like isoform X2 [Acanthaster planci]